MKGGRSNADATRKAESKLSVKKKGVEKASARPAKKAKPRKDPNQPKRPPSAFFVFMEEFRETFKKKNPGEKRVSVVGKAGGVKWKSLSEADKAPYVTKANKLKVEYDKKMITYKKNEASGANKSVDEEESDKSKSEVNDEDDEEGSEEDGDEEDDD